MESHSNSNNNNNSSNSSVLPEPLKVVPRLYKSKLSPLHITPIRRLNFIDPDFLPKFQMGNNMLQNISLIQLDPSTAMEWGMTSYYIKIQKLTSSSYRLGVLFKYDEHSWGIYYLHRDLKLKKLKEMKDEIIEESEPGVIEVDDLEEDLTVDLSNFTMHPPSLEIPQSSPIKDDINTDPEHYIKEKYYSALYSNADLMFFAKSTFARLKVLCGSNLQMLEKILMSTMLSIDEFNQRYDFTNKLFFVFPKDDDSIEAALKSRFLETNVTENDEAKLNLIKRKLKIREIKLQLIVLMELVIVKKDSDDVSSMTIIKQESKKKPSLVRKKNKKRNLVPTLNGTLIDPNSIEETTNDDISLEMCKSGVRKFLDMLIVVNSIENDQDSDEDLKHRSDIIDFLSNIIVPFYYKKVTELCKELIKTVKGVSMKRKHQRKEAKTLPALQPGVTLNSKPKVQQAQASSSISDSTIKASKLPTLPAIPSLQRSNKSGLDELFMPRPSLKRSASMISSTKLLEKRTIDFSSNANFKKEDANISQLPKQDLKNSKGIFGTIQSQKSSTADDNLKKSICEIGETPVKKQKFINLELDIDDSQVGERNLQDKLFQVAATPDNKITTRHRNRLEAVESSTGTIDDHTELESSALSLNWKESSDFAAITTTLTSPVVDISSSPVAQRQTEDIQQSYKQPPVMSKPVSSAIRRKHRELKTNFTSLKNRRNSNSFISNTSTSGNSTLIPVKPGDPIVTITSPVMSRVEEKGQNNRNSHWLNGSPYQRPRKKSS